jgi:hypothetical protein
MEAPPDYHTPWMPSARRDPSRPLPRFRTPGWYQPELHLLRSRSSADAPTEDQDAWDWVVSSCVTHGGREATHALLLTTMLTPAAASKPHPQLCSQLSSLCAEAVARVRNCLHQWWQPSYEYTFILETIDGETRLRGPLRSPGIKKMRMPKTKLSLPMPPGPPGSVQFTMSASYRLA